MIQQMNVKSEEVNHVQMEHNTELEERIQAIAEENENLQEYIFDIEQKLAFYG